MVKRQHIRWSEETKKSAILVFAQAIILFGYNFLLSMHPYWSFAYLGCFIVGFLENYYIFEVLQSLRFIFVTINDKLERRTRVQRFQSTEKCLECIIQCTTDHYDTVLLANRANVLFGYVMTPWFALNFFALTGELYYTWMILKAVIRSHQFTIETALPFTNVFMILSNLIFSIGAWTSTANEVSLIGFIWYGSSIIVLFAL